MPTPIDEVPVSESAAHSRSLAVTVATVALLSFAAAAGADATESEVPRSWTFAFTFENDLFGDTDQNYTNGIKASWVSPDLDSVLQPFVVLYL